jgi:hypothetical protein
VKKWAFEPYLINGARSCTHRNYFQRQ